MGKKLTQPSLKIAKKQTTSHQFNSLIKVLKPKVYITDSSNFKTLVQELTGNESSSLAISNSLSPPTIIPVVSSEPTNVIQIDDDGSPDPSLDCSSDPSLDNMFMPFDYSYCSSEEVGITQWPQDHVIDYVNEIELRNLESWLLDFDPSACIHDGPFVPMYTYGYDCNLSSIM